MVDGGLMVGAVVGYSYDSFVSRVTLSGENILTGHDTEFYGPANMIGGIVGAGMDSVIADCEATADIVLGDGAHDAGLIGGGLEVTSVLNSTASGTITAVAVGSKVTLTVTAQNVETYQWYYRTSANGAWIAMGGETRPTVTLTAGAGMNGYQYKCAVKGRGGSAESKVATLKVLGN